MEIIILLLLSVVFAAVFTELVDNHENNLSKQQKDSVQFISTVVLSIISTIAVFVL